MGRKTVTTISGLAAVLAGWLLACFPIAYADDLDAAAKTGSVQLTKLVFKIDAGTTMGSTEVQPDCMYDGALWWKGDDSAASLAPSFGAAFSAGLKQNGYTVVGDPDDLFDDSSEGSEEYQVAGVIDRINADLCYPLVAFQDFNSVHGDALIHVTWQLYSVQEHKVVFQISTSGTYNSKVNEHDWKIPLRKAFADAADQLLKNPDFRNALVEKSSPPPLDRVPAEPVGIPELAGYKTALSKHLDAVKAAVVTIYTSDATGSGVVISKDGYILTDAHVVGGADSVKVKLVDGQEMTGIVERRSHRRDAALIKVEQSNMAALPIRASDPKVGDDVYALGSSLGTYESTLTKGIVSAYREEGGNNYIQSDVNIQHGNSGGALMDADGNLIGLAESGVEIAGAPAGVNFFNPIMETLATLNIVIR